MNEITLPPDRIDEDPAAERSRLEARADRLKRRLFAAVAILDGRRHRLFDVRHHLRTHPVLVATVAGVLIAAAVVALRPKPKPRRLEFLRERGEALRRAWEHPERVARRKPTQSVWQEMGRRALLALLTAALVAPLQAKAQTLLARKRSG